MSELVVILTDYFPTRDCGDAPSQSAASNASHARALPRLPALETLLARAHRRALPEGWRAWLAARVGAPAQSPARTVAAAAGMPLKRAQYWLATPVHLVAQLDSVQLHPQGLLQLSGETQRQLVDAFACVFADSPWRLRSLDQRELLLQGPALQASGLDPARCLGEDPSGGLPRGPEADTLKRLGAEIELWLHQHPINLEREQRGELPITTLWFWGAALGGDAAEPHPLAWAGAARHMPRLFGRDTYADALWRLQGASSAPAPAQFGERGPSGARGEDEILLYPATTAPSGLPAALQVLEGRWLVAASRALRRRRLRALSLLTGTTLHRLTRLDLARLWRARRPWWQRL